MPYSIHENALDVVVEGLLGRSVSVSESFERGSYELRRWKSRFALCIIAYKTVGAT